MVMTKWRWRLSWLAVMTKRWSTFSGQSGNEAMERDGAHLGGCRRAKKDIERAIGEAVVLGAEVDKVQNELLGEQ